jgi:hypothetical protein
MRILLAAASLGTMLVASVAAAAPGVANPRTLATRFPVWALAGDGDRVALPVWSSSRSPRGRCGVVVWEPTRSRVVRF